MQTRKSKQTISGARRARRIEAHEAEILSKIHGRAYFKKLSEKAFFSFPGSGRVFMSEEDARKNGGGENIEKFSLYADALFYSRGEQ